MTKIDPLPGRDRLRSYYRFQSRIYDATRWSFLFGRRRILRRLPYDPAARLTILEVGCGTGSNLRKLARRFPNAQLIGLDLSEDMLDIARRKTVEYSDRLSLIEGAYGTDMLPTQPDVVLFSYCLSMINPGYDTVIHRAVRDLRAGGHLAVVDFHWTPRSWFADHMGGHYVRMEKHLNPVFDEVLTPVWSRSKAAYGGLWYYFEYVGRK